LNFSRLRFFIFLYNVSKITIFFLEKLRAKLVEKLAFAENLQIKQRQQRENQENKNMEVPSQSLPQGERLGYARFFTQIAVN